MAIQTITLDIPDALYQTALRLADATKRPIDDVVRESLMNTLPPLDDVSAVEVDSLAHLSMLGDDALWDVAGYTASDAEQHELAHLLDVQERGEIVGHEKERLEQILNQHSNMMLKKAHAWLLLARRGYSVPVHSN